MLKTRVRTPAALNARSWRRTRVKTLIVFVITAALTSSAGAPATKPATQPASFPQSWIGNWTGTGELLTPGGKRTGIRTELHVAATDDPNRFTWRLIYGDEGAEGR